MSKSAFRQSTFRELRGNFSTRINANGKYQGFAIPELFDTLKNQYRYNRLRLQEIQRISETRSLTDEERRELADRTRRSGSWSKTIREIGQITFENAFIIVAEAMLPKEHFLTITKEARELWRGEGYADMPVDQHKVRKEWRRCKRKELPSVEVVKIAMSPEVKIESERMKVISSLAGFGDIKDAFK